MSKYHVTKKAVNDRYNRIIMIGYCRLQPLLSYFEPEAYTSGVYGWNTDIYHINAQTAIVTGYRPFGNIKPNYQTVDKYEQEADAIDYHIDYQTRKNIAQNIMARFIEEVTDD